MTSPPARRAALVALAGCGGSGEQTSERTEDPRALYEQALRDLDDVGRRHAGGRPGARLSFGATQTLRLTEDGAFNAVRGTAFPDYELELTASESSGDEELTEVVHLGRRRLAAPDRRAGGAQRAGLRPGDRRAASGRLPLRPGEGQAQPVRPGPRAQAGRPATPRRARLRAGPGHHHRPGRRRGRVRRLEVALAGDVAPAPTAAGDAELVGLVEVDLTVGLDELGQPQDITPPDASGA